MKMSERQRSFSIVVIVFLILLSATLIGYHYPIFANVFSSARTETSPKYQFMSHDKLYEILYGNKSDMSSILSSAIVKKQYFDLIRSYMTGPNLSKPINLANYDKNRIKQGGGQTLHVLKKLSSRRNGFFIESGALDGDFMSNTLYFEMELQWTGLLVEPDPASHKTLLTKNRRAIVFNSCLSPTRKSQQTSFLAARLAGGIVDYLPKTQFERQKHSGKFHEVRCFPVEDVLAAIGVSHVDFWNLDVEGPEAEILATVDWDRTIVDIVGVEPHEHKAIAAIRRVMNKTGRYREFVSANGPYQNLMYERIK